MNAIKKVIFFVQAPFNQRDFERFGINILRENKFDVEVWDATFVLRPNLRSGSRLAIDFECKGLKIYENRKSFCSEIAALDKTDFVINTIPYNGSTIDIYRSLSVSGAHYGVMMSNILPSFKRSGVLGIAKMCKNIFTFNLNRAYGKLLHILPFRLFGIKPARIIFAGGSQYFINIYPATAKTEVLACHTFDYDLFIKESRLENSSKGKAVFLDQDLSSHSDYAFNGMMEPFISEDRYSFLLNKFFNGVKKKTGLDITIAAHPRLSCRTEKNVFNGYEVTRGKTASLIRESKLVLAHDSTALGLANLFRKPVIFITSSELDKTREGAYIREMAKWFGKSPIFMDQDLENIDWDKEFYVNEAVYDKYKENYIKMKGSEEQSYWQIVAKRIGKGV